LTAAATGEKGEKKGKAGKKKKERGENVVNGRITVGILSASCIRHRWRARAACGREGGGKKKTHGGKERSLGGGAFEIVELVLRPDAADSSSGLEKRGGECRRKRKREEGSMTAGAISCASRSNISSSLRLVSSVEEEKKRRGEIRREKRRESNDEKLRSPAILKPSSALDGVNHAERNKTGEEGGRRTTVEGKKIKSSRNWPRKQRLHAT